MQHGAKIESQVKLEDRKKVVEQLETIARHEAESVAAQRRLTDLAHEYFSMSMFQGAKKKKLLGDIGIELKTLDQSAKTNSIRDVQAAKDICDLLDHAYGGKGIYYDNAASRPQTEPRQIAQRFHAAYERMAGSHDLSILSWTHGFVKGANKNSSSAQAPKTELTAENLLERVQASERAFYSGDLPAYHKIVDHLKFIKRWGNTHAIDPGDSLPEEKIARAATASTGPATNVFGLGQDQRSHLPVQEGREQSRRV